jgi:hypothetical protein
MSSSCGDRDQIWSRGTDSCWRAAMLVGAALQPPGSSHADVRRADHARESWMRLGSPCLGLAVGPDVGQRSCIPTMSDSIRDILSWTS